MALSKAYLKKEVGEKHKGKKHESKESKKHEAMEHPVRGLKSLKRVAKKAGGKPGSLLTALKSKTKAKVKGLV